MLRTGARAGNLLTLAALDDVGACSYFSYFTHLSYIGLCAYFCAAGVQTFFYARSGKGYPLQSWPRALQYLHVLLYSTIVTFREYPHDCFFPSSATTAKWDHSSDSRDARFLDSPLRLINFRDPIFLSVISPPSDQGSRLTKKTAWSNISQHALNTVFTLFEILLTNVGPLPWLHLPICIVLLACYLGVAYITHATQGFYRTSTQPFFFFSPQPYYPTAPSSISSTLTPIPHPSKLTTFLSPIAYGFLNPSKEHARLAGYIVGIAVAQCIIFLLVRGAIVLRQRLVLRRPGSLPEKQDTREAIDA